VGFLAFLVGALCFVIWLLVFGRIMLSWFDPRAASPLARFLVESTEPILGPIRRVLRQAGMFDLSGLLVLIVLGAIWRQLL